MTRNVTNIEQQLRLDEGEKLHAYADHLGFMTIGVGRLIDKRKGGGISIAESTMLLENDIASKRAELVRRAPWVERLDPVRRGALLNMAFQMGVDGLLGFVNTLRMVASGDYEGASRGMLQSLWAKQTPARALRIATQMRTGEWQ